MRDDIPGPSRFAGALPGARLPQRRIVSHEREGAAADQGEIRHLVRRPEAIERGLWVVAPGRTESPCVPGLSARAGGDRRPLRFVLTPVVRTGTESSYLGWPRAQGGVLPAVAPAANCGVTM